MGALHLAASCVKFVSSVYAAEQGMLCARRGRAQLTSRDLYSTYGLRAVAVSHRGSCAVVQETRKTGHRAAF